jgi:FdhD protein
VEPVERVRIQSRDGDASVERVDSVAVEEPLEIKVRGAGDRSLLAFVTTMRTPGNDVELAAGLLFAEGVLRGRADLVSLEPLADVRVAPELRDNVLVATLSEGSLARATKLARTTVMGSACGVCGKTSIENVIPSDAAPIESQLGVDPDLLRALPDRLKASQSVFAQTGGLHAAGLFTSDGELVALREDIGRHNALDKLVGRSWLADELPLRAGVLVVSGRAGFEIVQKAFAAGIPVMASVSAPSSLAVELAETGGITLVGFLRGRRFNVYAHAGRIRPAASG